MILNIGDELLISRSRDGTGRNSHSPHSVVHVRSIARGAAAQILKQEMRCIPTTMFQPPLVVVFFLVARSLCKFYLHFCMTHVSITNLHYISYTGCFFLLVRPKK